MHKALLNNHDLVNDFPLLRRCGVRLAATTPVSSDSQSGHPGGSRGTPPPYPPGPRRTGLRAVVAKGSPQEALTAKVGLDVVTVFAQFGHAY